MAIVDTRRGAGCRPGDTGGACGNWAPKNYSGGSSGRSLPAIDAFRMSLNIPAVKVLAAVGPGKLVGRMRRAGILEAELAGAEATIEHLLKPLFRGYAALLRERGIPCDCSFSANAREGQPNFVRRYAWATFLIGGGDLPGVSDSYLRFENDGGGWQVVARPAINKHVQLGNMSREFLLVNDTLKAAVEAKLQLYLRIALADPAR